jgi:beta-ureidopropionase
MKNSIRIALIKTVPEKGNLSKNHRTLIRLLDDIGVEAVDVVVTPECFLDGYVCTREEVTEETIHEYAIDPNTSAAIQEAKEWANAAKTWLILGCMRIESTGNATGDAPGIYNTSLAIDRSGSIAGIFDKVHCQTHDRKYNAGASLPVFESDFGRFGMMICADRRWPETVRTLAIQGARIIFNPTYGMHDERNLRMMQTRSYESEVYIAFAHPRQSLVTDPRGEIMLNSRDDSEEVAYCEINLATVDRVRSGASAHLKDLRRDVYR